MKRNIPKYADVLECGCYWSFGDLYEPPHWEGDPDCPEHGEGVEDEEMD